MRNDLLSQAWTGPPLVLGGREINLSIGKYMLLESWHNPLFDRRNPSDISETSAMGELVIVMHANLDDLMVLRKMTTDERRAAVLDFMIAYDDEIAAIADGITERLKATEAAAVEIDDLGKQPEGRKA